jgi:hypothetical protein
MILISLSLPVVLKHTGCSVILVDSKVHAHTQNSVLVTICCVFIVTICCVFNFVIQAQGIIKHSYLEVLNCHFVKGLVSISSIEVKPKLKLRTFNVASLPSRFRVGCALSRRKFTNQMFLMCVRMP